MSRDITREFKGSRAVQIMSREVTMVVKYYSEAISRDIPREL